MTERASLLSAEIGAYCDAALILSEENRFYFSGFAASDGFLLITPEQQLVFTDSRYIEAAKKTIGAEKVHDSFNIYAELNEIFHRKGIKSVALEADRVTLSRLDTLRQRLPGVRFITDSLLCGSINGLRMIKSPAELEKIKAAQRIAESAFRRLLGFIKPGVSEKEAALELDYYMLSGGADALSFETIAASGKNSSMPHAVPSDRRFENGDFITFDFGAVKDGYHSDMTRTVALGKVSEKQKKIYSVVLSAQKNALSALRAGLELSQADSAARDIIKSAGYGDFFGHSTGHGVGIEIHEQPNLSPCSAGLLKEGSVVTVEPGIYLPGEFGVRIEDMAFITENGCENLTDFEKELIIL